MATKRKTQPRRKGKAPKKTGNAAPANNPPITPAPPVAAANGISRVYAEPTFVPLSPDQYSLGRVKVNVANWARRLYKQEWN